MTIQRNRSSLTLTRLESRDIPSGTQLLAIAEDSGASRVAVYTAPVDHLITPPGGGQSYFQRESKLLKTFTPYPGFGGGVRLALGDVTGDNVDDVVTAPGFGGGAHIKIYNGAELLLGNVVLVKEFFAFDASFRGGAFVAVGQMDPASPQNEIVVGAGESGGSHVKVFALEPVFFIQAPPNPTDYYAVRFQSDFFAFDASFRGGVRVATGDVNGDGRAEVIAAAGPGGGPHVRVFDVNPPNPLAIYLYIHKVIDEFYAYDASFRGGVYVAAGNLVGDTKAEVVTGPGMGGGPHVKVFSTNSGGKLALKDELFADSTNEGQGARVGIVNIATDPNVDSTLYPMHSIYVGFASREPRAYAFEGNVIVNVDTLLFPPGERRINAFDYVGNRLTPSNLALPFGLDGDERQGLFVGV